MRTRNEVAADIRSALSKYTVVPDTTGRRPFSPNSIMESSAAAWTALADKLESGTISNNLTWEQLPTEYQVMSVITHIFNSSIVAQDQMRFFE